MNLRDMEYLVTLADLRHFGRAAEACHVSQSTLSIQIKKLEDALGVTLFERTNKQVLPTREGEAVIRSAQAIVDEVRHMRDLAAQARDPFAGELRLGAFPTLAPYLFPSVAPALKKAMPKLKLFLVEEKTDVLLAQLRAGEIDCALLAMPVDNAADLTALRLFDEPFFLAVGAAHPLAGRKTIATADVKNDPILLLDEGHCLRGQSLEFCERIGTGEARGYRATSLETLRNMVAAGEGITLIPRMAVRKGDTDVAYLPFRAPAPGRTIGLYHRASSHRAALFNKVSEVVREHSR